MRDNDRKPITPTRAHQNRASALLARADEILQASEVEVDSIENALVRGPEHAQAIMRLALAESALEMDTAQKERFDRMLELSEAMTSSASSARAALARLHAISETHTRPQDSLESERDGLITDATEATERALGELTSSLGELRKLLTGERRRPRSSTAERLRAPTAERLRSAISERLRPAAAEELRIASPEESPSTPALLRPWPAGRRRSRHDGRNQAAAGPATPSHPTVSENHETGRLVALEMMLSGQGRDEVEVTLRKTLARDELSAVLNEVFGT